MDQQIFPNLQPTLFNTARKDFLGKINLPEAIFSQWYKEGLLSYDLAEKEELSNPEELEALFIAKLFQSGLSLTIIQTLLKDLPKPYSYNYTEVYFDVFSAKWQYRPEELNEDNYENIALDYIEKMDNIEEIQNMVMTLEQRLSDLE